MISHYKQIIFAVWAKLKKSIVFDTAAALAFFTILSLFPFLIAAISIASLFVDSTWVMDRARVTLGEYFPNANNYIMDLVHGIINERGAVGTVSTLGLFWSGGKVFGTLTSALNRIFGVEDSFSYFKSLALQLLMTLTIGLLFIIGLGSSVAIGYLADLIPNHILSTAGTSLFKYLLPAIILFLALFLSYRFVPRRKPSSMAAAKGALTGTILIVGAQPIFSYYIGQFANFNVVYGSLSILISLMVWIWVAAIITLFGGALAAQLDSTKKDRIHQETAL